MHCWAHFLTNCAMKFFWRRMQAHVGIQCILIFVYLFAQWTGKSSSSILICIHWSQTMNILYNYIRLHRVFFLYNSVVQHSYKNDTIGYPPRKKTNLLSSCYSIFNSTLQMFQPASHSPVFTLVLLTLILIMYCSMISATISHQLVNITTYSYDSYKYLKVL